MQTYAPPARGLQTCCCAEGHGDDHPLHHQEETEATLPRHLAMYPGARSGGAGHLRQEGGPANHRPERCPSRHHYAIKQGKFITCAAGAGVHLLCAKQIRRQPRPRRRSVDGRPPRRRTRPDAARTTSYPDQRRRLGLASTREFIESSSTSWHLPRTGGRLADHAFRQAAFGIHQR